MALLQGQEALQWLQNNPKSAFQVVNAGNVFNSDATNQVISGVEKPGLVKSVVKGMLDPWVRGIISASSGLTQLGGLDEGKEIQREAFGKDSSLGEELYRAGTGIGAWMIPGINLGSGALAKIGSGALQGAMSGGLTGLSMQKPITGDFNVGDVAKSTAYGGLAGGAIAGIGEGLKKLAGQGQPKVPTSKVGGQQVTTEQLDDMLASGKYYAKNQITDAANATLATPKQVKELGKLLGSNQVTSVDDISNAAQAVGMSDDVVDDLMRNVTTSNLPPETGNLLQRAGKKITASGQGLSPDVKKNDISSIRGAKNDIDAISWANKQAGQGSAASLDDIAYLPSKIGEMRGNEVANLSVERNVDDIVKSAADSLKKNADIKASDIRGMNLDDYVGSIVQNEMDDILASQKVSTATNIDPTDYIAGNYPINEKTMYDMTQILGDDTANYIRLERLGGRQANITQQARHFIDQEVSNTLAKASPTISRLNRAFQAIYRQYPNLVTQAKRGGTISATGGRLGLSRMLWDKGAEWLGLLTGELGDKLAGTSTNVGGTGATSGIRQGLSNILGNQMLQKTAQQLPKYGGVTGGVLGSSRYTSPLQSGLNTTSTGTTGTSIFDQSSMDTSGYQSSEASSGMYDDILGGIDAVSPNDYYNLMFSQGYDLTQ